MSGTTPLYDLPFPEGTDEARLGADAVEALATKLEAVLAPAAVAGVTGGGSSGFDLSGLAVRRSGALCHISGTITKGTGVLGVPANGNITNADVASIGLLVPEPAFTQHIGCGGTGRLAAFSIVPSPDMSAPTIALNAVAGGGDIEPGEVLSFSGLYLTADPLP